MRLRMLGGLRLERDGVEVDLGRPRQRFVLAVLAIEANRVVATDRLTDLLWGTDGPNQRASLHAYISNLRRALDPARDRSVLVRQAPGYRLVLARDDVDALQFEDLVDRGIADGDLDALRAAIALWDTPLPELADEPVVIEATRRWHSLLGAALEAAGDLLLKRRDPQATTQLLAPHLPDFPLRERLAVIAATAMYRTGRQADALRVIDRARGAVADVGLDATAQLVTLERQILDHDEALDDDVAPPTATSLFGREHERAELRQLVAKLTERRGGVVTISGPAGIGKTALVEDLTGSLGAVTMRWARCPEGAAVPPFWPLTKLGMLDTTDAADGDPFTVAQRIADRLAATNAAQVLVVDDLQWADDDTLRVLTQLAAEARATSTLLIATARPLTADASPDLVACTGELARQRIADLTLDPLSADDVRAWLGSRGDLAVTVHERSGGNPLFVGEFVRLVADGSIAGVDAVPPGVQAVVRRRLGQLQGMTQRVLAAAAVVGARIDRVVVGDVAEADPRAVVDAIRDGLESGLLVEDEAGEVRFSHVIVADALAAEFNPLDRHQLHARAARSIARHHPDDDHATEVAFHAARGDTADDAALAADAATRAARVASAHGAYAEAAHQLSIAAAAVERGTPQDLSRRVEVWVALASAHERADEMAEARGAVVRAIDLARGIGDWAAVGRAAAALNHASIWPNQPYPFVDHELVAVLEATIDAMPEHDSAARVCVLGALGTELMHSGEGARRDAVSIEAVEIARRLGDAALLARALHARTFSLKAPLAVPERRRVGAEVAELAEGHALGADVELLGGLQVALADLALGDLDAVSARLPRCVALLDLPVGLALRSQLGYFRTLVEVVRGRHGEAIARAGEVHALFRRTRPVEADVFAFAQRLTIGHDLGDIADGDLDAAGRADATGFGLVMRLYSAVILFDLDRRAEAMARVPYPIGEVPDRPLDYVTTFIDVAAAHVAAERDDIAAVPTLLARLEPFAGRWAHGGTGAGSLGLVDLAIARLHATAGDADAAATWFVRSVEAHERIGAPAWLARSLLHQGSDLDRAAALADAYGLPIVAAQVARRQGSA